MYKFSNNKTINYMVRQLLKQGWHVRKGKKHDVLIAPNNRRCAIPGSPSDYRAILNFNRDIKNLLGI
ncbi:phosphoribosylglycinamide formyltransferase [Neisseria montereyensis]|uniref:Phosphoribosylglycinamide formyltransferase n=1 Tax=Neisseria montereyensis TaxID=2973938 RepID=A0ABT2FAU2_9NEIS|nr:phosphoribosylglycinamide formyltransferase [Neisseria montereyensis]MCS4533304.1 phosphoribosylglycinamide formyltransferase [Neisseria montereyensis]